MRNVAVLVMNKHVANLTQLEKALDISPNNILIHSDVNSKLSEHNGIKLPFSYKCFWGSPELAFAMFESFEYIFDKWNFDYIISISDDSLPNKDWWNQFTYLSRFFKMSVLESHLEEGLAEFGVNFGITSKYEPAKWKRRYPLDVYKGNQWTAITRSDFQILRDKLSQNADLIDEIYHMYIPDERAFPTLFNYFNIPFINSRYMYMPFADNNRNVKFISESEYKTVLESGKTYPFMRKYNWDSPAFNLE